MDTFTKEKRSEIMSKIRSKGNLSTEQYLVQLLKAAKLSGWRRNYKLFGKPDLVFPSQRLAIFIDGCFWHGCLLCGHLPKSNIEYWRKKIERNRKRDKSVSKHLRSKNWHVIRIKECQLKKRPSVQISKIKIHLAILK